MTHGFFISMGGFTGRKEYPITATYFFSSYRDISGLDIVTKDELMDKSKGDALSKCISLLQTTWFVVQYFSRITLSLPTTPLETATLAFALLNFCNYILWWHKPLDVQYPLNFPTIDAEPEDWVLSTLQFARSEGSESLVSLVQLPTNKVLEPKNPVTSAAESEFNSSGYADTASGNRPSSPLLPTHNNTASVHTTNCSHIPTSPNSIHQLSVDYIKSHASELVCCRECLECDISNPRAVSINDWRFFHAEAGSTFNELCRCRGADEWSVFQTSTDSIDILPTVDIVSPDAVATGKTSVTKYGKPRRRYWLGFHQNFFMLIPALCVKVWTWYRLILGRILSGGWRGRHPTRTLPMLWAGQPQNDPSQMDYSAFFGGCFGALFGGVHCIGWSSSGFFDSSLEHLLWKISSLLVAIVPVILAFEILTILKLKWIVNFMRLSTPIFIFVYICARVYLLVDMFVSLRSLPPGALEEIDWMSYIPHI